MTTEVEGYKLSPQQRHAWRCGGAIAGRILTTVDLDRKILHAGLEQMALHHEILRTCFVVPPGMQFPVQVILEQGSFAVRELDVADLSESGKERALGELWRQELEAPFDLKSGPTVRATLVRVGSLRKELVIALPSMCLDRASLGILVRDLAAHCSGSMPVAREVLQYADFSEWQNEVAAEEGEGRAWWSRPELVMSPPFRLPFTKPREKGSFLPATVAWTIEPRRWARIKDLAARLDVKPASVLLTAWQSVLRRFSGPHHQVLGEVCDGRKFGPLSGAIGPFARTVPFLGRLEDSFRFEEATTRTERESSENRSWQEFYDPDRQVPGNEEPQGRHREPGWPISFEFEASFDRDREGSAWSLLAVGSSADPFKVRFACRTSSDLLRASLSYDPRCFPEREAAHLVGPLDALLGAAIADSARRLADLGSPTSSMRQRLAVELNDTAEERPAWSLLSRVAATAAMMPDRAALVWRDRTLSYRELDRCSTRLASRLAARGVRPGEVVGVLAERSPELVVILLAIWQAGAAYALLGPDQPPERLAHLLFDTAVRFVVSVESPRQAMPAATEILIFGDLLSDSESVDAAPVVAGGLDALAYVVYTSGSTGRPKGVLTHHRGIDNYLTYLVGAHGLTSEDSVLQIASPEFDASVREIFTPLSIGARLILPAAAEARDPAALIEAMRRERVTALLGLVPTMLRAISTEAETAAPLPLRLALISGEVLRREDCDRLRGIASPTIRIVNQYGPTECTMTSTFHVAAPEEAEGATVAIGRPIPNATLLLLDVDSMPVPLGAVGEVFIGGPGLAWGYLGLPALTAERFLPAPLGGGAGDRIYRTGDLARQRPDGTLDFLGRNDTQVKVRGIRVELGEIEAVLRRHPDLRDAAVDLRGAVEPRLVLYAVARPGRQPQLGELRRSLQRQLPESMIPAQMVLLASLPLTRTGKIDRRELPDPEEPGNEAAAGFSKPRTPTEELLAEIWSSLLGLEAVGVHADFFELGGHSLLATQLVARVRNLFEVELPLQSLFDRPTIAEFAHAIDATLASGSAQRVPAISRVQRGTDLPLSFAQQRHWFLHHLEPDSSLLNISAVLRLEGHLDAGVLRSSFAAITARHEVLRTSFPSPGGEPVQRILQAVEVEQPQVDLSLLAAEVRNAELARVARRLARRSFNLTEPPLLRVGLLRCGSEEYALSFTVHHIVADLWSMGVLVRELEEFYGAMIRGERANLPELTVQYADFSVWQRGWLTDDVLAEHLDHWLGRLASLPPPLLLPADTPREPERTVRSAQFVFSWPAERLDQSRELGRREGASLFMVLFAAFGVLLHSRAGVTDLVVGTPFANRSLPEAEGLIGCFINAVALRLDLAGNPTFRALLARVRRCVLTANAHQDLPFERLVEALNPDRATGLPLFQVVFNFQNAQLDTPDLPGLRVTESGLDTGAEAKYELTLYLREQSQGLVGSVRYDAGLFEAWRIEALVEDLAFVLDEVAEAPDRTLDELSLSIKTRDRERLAVRQREIKEQRRQRLLSVRRPLR